MCLNLGNEEALSNTVVNISNSWFLTWALEFH